MASQVKTWRSAKTVAATISVHPATVRRWCLAGFIRAKQTPGGEWRVEVDGEGWPIDA